MSGPVCYAKYNIYVMKAIYNGFVRMYYYFKCIMNSEMLYLFKLFDYKESKKECNALQ